MEKNKLRASRASRANAATASLERNLKMLSSDWPLLKLHGKKTRRVAEHLFLTFFPSLVADFKQQ